MFHKYDFASNIGIVFELLQVFPIVLVIKKKINLLTLNIKVSILPTLFTNCWSMCAAHRIRSTSITSSKSLFDFAILLSLSVVMFHIKIQKMVRKIVVTILQTIFICCNHGCVAATVRSCNQHLLSIITIYY